MFFLFLEIDCFGNQEQFNARTGQKKNTCFSFGNARRKSNARAHLKQKKNIVALLQCFVMNSNIPLFENELFVFVQNY